MRVLLTLFAFIFCSHTTLTATQTDVYREAQTHFEKGEYLLAMLAAQRAVQQDGQNAKYRYLYGAILLELKQYSEAEINLRQAVASEPNRAEFQYSLGELLLAKKNEAAILKEARSGVGQPRMRNVDPEGIKALERAVKLDPDLLKARLRLGRAYYDLNRHDLALQQFQTIARKNPRYPWIHSSLAVVYMNAGAVDSAVQALQTELRNYPDHHSARLELGEALLKAGDTAQAVEHLLQLKEEDVSPSRPRVPESFTLQGPPGPGPTGEGPGCLPPGSGVGSELPRRSLPAGSALRANGATGAGPPADGYVSQGPTRKAAENAGALAKRTPVTGVFAD